ncbi:MAG: helix-turn-helix domain-containing protein [Lachnospiraceae bacterium]|nr:helix-turn-helix domain-containing protein [Ruminococcus sp.]MCM1274920.1 helix-turn-helix domain-containing protein [Lachnospiraceae bacterium]
MHYVDYKEVGKRIAARRRELGLKQWQVNEMAGLCNNYLSNVERATTVISIDVLMKICAALDTTPDALLLGAVADDDNDYLRSMTNRMRQMSSQQARLTLSLMDWILSQKL